MIEQSDDIVPMNTLREAGIDVRKFAFAFARYPNQTTSSSAVAPHAKLAGLFCCVATHGSRSTV
jgi:hypothetical protein